VLEPTVQNAGAVDAQENTIANLLRAVVHVQEDVNSGLGVKGGLVTDTVNDAAGACCGGNLTRLEHIERQGIIGLVSGPIGNWRASLEAHFGSCFLSEFALNTKGRNQFREDV